jgi:hypothetical protein
MKSRQFCSVCKQWLDMEVVPTGDGDDDGVVWFRCPQCQGFLPKLSAASAEPGARAAADVDETPAAAEGSADDAAADGFDAVDRDLVDIADSDDDADDDADDDTDDETEVAPPRPAGANSQVTAAEPIMEYAAMLAAVDPETSVPYRPWDSYQVGQCVLHLAWNDCGVVVAKEVLPGGRHVIKCWFQGAGVVRLIENTPR